MIMPQTQNKADLASANDLLILVDKNDKAIGSATKEEAHRKGLLHRAFSVFVQKENQLLLQRRAYNKYHSGGLWTNACCSHPRVGETLETATQLRMQEELGIALPLTELFSFTYRTEFSSELFEHEYDHVFLGTLPEHAVLRPNPEEIAELRWVSLPNLKTDLSQHPEQYTSWFQICAPAVIDYLERS